MKAKAAAAKDGVYVPPGIEPSATLRPEVVARIELLRIVWQPGKDAGLAIKAAAALERYVLTGMAPEQSGDGG